MSYTSDPADWSTPDPSQPHPIDLIEPEEDIRSDTDERAVEAIAAIFQELLPQRETNIVIRLEEGYRRFVALAGIVRPDLMDGVSQTFVANLANCSPAAISKITNELSDRFGMIGRSQKQRSTRAAMREAQLHRERSGAGRKLGANTGAAAHEKAVKKAIYEARRRWKRGEAFTKFQILSLLEMGFLEDDRSTMTPPGLEWLSAPLNTPIPAGADGPTHPPGREPSMTPA